MKSIKNIQVALLILICILTNSCEIGKKKKFLDYFITYKYDTLSVSSTNQSGIYMDPNTPSQLKGNVIDSIFFNEMDGDGAEDLLAFLQIGNEKGPIAYYKINLDDGFYFIIIRSGGGYWNSRYFGCIYNVGAKKIDGNILIAEMLGFEGFVFSCNAVIKKEEKKWNIYTHQRYQLPINFEKYGTDSLRIDEIDILYTIEKHDEHFFFEEKSVVKTWYKSQ